MFQDKYVELEKLKKKNHIGKLLIAIILVLLFVGPAFIPMIAPGLTEYIEGNDLYIMMSILVFVVSIIAIVTNLCSPYRKLKNEINLVVKDTILKSEMNNTFNNTYKVENSSEFDSKLRSLNIINRQSYINDCFSAKYNNVRFKYADARFYHSSDDSTVTDFQGPIFEFDLKNQLEGDLYIGSKQKVLFTYYSEIDSLMNKSLYKEIKPENSILNEKIIIKSNANPSIINNSSFQEIINELLSKDRYMLIYKDNKLYVLIFNYKDTFEIEINNSSDEIKAKEQITNDIKFLREELDAIIKYKDVLNIKDEDF